MDNILPVLLSWESGLFGEGGEKDGYCTEYEERLLHSSSEPNTWEGLLHNSKLDTWEGLLHNSSKPNGENSVLEACFLAGGAPFLRREAELLQDELADFGVGHFLDFVHRFAIVDALDSFVDDAVADSQHGLAGIISFQPGDELLGAALEAFKALDIIGPLLHGLQIGNELAGETAPVSLSEQGRGDNGFAMRFGNDLASLDGTVEIAGYKGVDVYILHPVAYSPSLFLARFIEFTGGLSLKDLCFVGHGFAVTY